MTHGGRRGVCAAAAVVALVALLASCTGGAPDGGTDADGATTSWAALPERQVAETVTSRLADDEVPPTNRWYSGIVFGDEPTPVYPYPLAFTPTGSTFALELPPVSVTATTSAASAGEGLVVGTEGTSFEVTRTDPVSVTLSYRDNAGPVGDVTVAEGWAVVGFVAARETTLTAPGDLAAAGEGVWSITAAGRTYGVLAPEARASGATLRLPEGASAQWFAVPADSTVQAWASALGAPIAGVETSFSLEEDTVTTRLTYAAEGTTALVASPGHAAAAGCDLGTFETAYGPATVCAAGEITQTADRLDPTATYDLDGIDDTDRAKIVAALETDLDTTPALPPDTYGAGKALARLGSLGLLARSLGEEALADRAAERLWSELSPWMQADGCLEREERCFVYDPELRTVVGLTPSFGSEEANDHHFHYGYFLSAAAALATLAPEHLDDTRTVVSALADDIASGDGESLPSLRTFDPYRGHSWASGLSPFADGNNQESSSEAVMAWNALALWGEAVGDDGLVERATWMLSAEASAAISLWLEPDLTGIPGAENFAHSIVSLTWGGKRDYATWFSAEPSAILGIQLIPVAPIGLQYLGENPERVRRNVADAGGAAAFDGALGDGVLAYSALGGADAASTAAAAVDRLADSAIDSGSARSLLLAWLAAVRS